jgi:GT2 family glycosyltransferase
LKNGAEHVFLLNQDAYLIDDVVEKLVDFQKKNLDYGIVRPIHLNGDGTRLDINFSRYVSYKNNGDFYSDYVLKKSLKQVYDVPFVNAAAWLVSKNCFEIVGGFDPLFFHYGEDENYCQRVLYHGLKIGVLSDSFVRHDRENRKELTPLRFSPEYFRKLENHYKVIFANVNSKQTPEKKIISLKKAVLKSLIAMRFKRANRLKMELKLFYELKSTTAKSRKLNSNTGSHYLDVENTIS